MLLRPIEFYFPGPRRHPEEKTAGATGSASPRLRRGPLEILAAFLLPRCARPCWLCRSWDFSPWGLRRWPVFRVLCNPSLEALSVRLRPAPLRASLSPGCARFSRARSCRPRQATLSNICAPFYRQARLGVVSGPGSGARCSTTRPSGRGGDSARRGAILKFGGARAGAAPEHEGRPGGSAVLYPGFGHRSWGYLAKKDSGNKKNRFGKFISWVVFRPATSR